MFEPRCLSWASIGRMPWPVLFRGAVFCYVWARMRSGPPRGPSVCPDFPAEVRVQCCASGAAVRWRGLASLRVPRARPIRGPALAAVAAAALETTAATEGAAARRAGRCAPAGLATLLRRTFGM
eukprot:4591773-Pyramimonas_sp.AAC.1